MKLANSYIRHICILLLTVSCETNVSDASHEVIPNKSIHLNFRDNILLQNPIEANNPAERFVAELVFDKFIDENFRSSIFESYQVDSLQGIYTFNIQDDKYFHNGQPINAEAIRSFLKYLLQEHYDHEVVKLLISSMKGYAMVNWLKENRNISDSIPNGFQVIGDKQFSIQLSSNRTQLLEWFQDPVFTLFKEEKGAYIGSGEFELDHLNEDISAKLIRKTNHNSNIQSIELTFIKNHDLAYAEFFRGALDIILYHPELSPKTNYSQRLNKIITSQYPEYQVTHGMHSLLKYLEIRQVPDSVILQKLATGLLNGSKSNIYLASQDKTWKFSPKQILKPIENDSVKLTIQWYSIDLENDREYFRNTESVEFVYTSEENFNQTDPQIVIKEMITVFVSQNDLKNATIELANTINEGESAVFMILEDIPEYVIYNNRLEGIKSFSTLSDMVKKANFKEVRTY